jgi:hypothetical protein
MIVDVISNYIFNSHTALIIRDNANHKDASMLWKLAYYERIALFNLSLKRILCINITMDAQIEI